MISRGLLLSATLTESLLAEGAYKSRCFHRRPPAKHFDPAAFICSKSPQWSRERVIAGGMRFIGDSFQQHHVLD